MNEKRKKRQIVKNIFTSNISNVNMKRITSIISWLTIFYYQASAQLFTGPGGTISNNGVEIYFDLSISGLTPAQLNNTFGIEEVCVNIDHPNVEELSIYLESPAGNVVQLAEGSSAKGANYTNTCFNSRAIASVTLINAPYTGIFRPIGYLGRFNNGQSANGTWKLIVKDYLAFINSGTVISWSIQFGNTPSPPVTFTSSNLPIVIINTHNKILSDSTTLVSIGIIDNGINQRNNITDAYNNYNGKGMLRFRGHSSKIFEKKPYSIETCDAGGNELVTSLLGMPPETDWNLIAMYQDKSLIRVPMTYDFARKTGRYAARFKTVEVVLNGEYRGIYSFMEKPNRNKNRIDVSKMVPTDNFFPAITGGYILKIDRADEAGWFSLLEGNAQNNAHFYYQYVYPRSSTITSHQKNYIRSFIDSFETVMSSPYFADPLIGYQKYIDTESFIDYFIINELSKNVDGYRLSTYLYKDNVAKGGKLHIGPIWDYDIAWYNCNHGNSFDPTGWQHQLTDTVYPIPMWWNRFMQDTSFTNKLYCRWNQLRKNFLTNNYLHQYIDSTVLAMHESQQRNFIQWPILGAYIYPNPQNQINATYQSEVDDLKNWITNRISWLDWAITGYCPIIGIQENNAEVGVVISPNPSTGKFILKIENEKWLLRNPIVDIYNAIGEKVFTAIIYKHQSLTIDLSFHPAGIYFYQLKVNDIVKTGKIIVR